MNAAQRGKNVTVHWMGLDVAKKTFDAGLLLHGALGQMPALSALPAKRFVRSREGAAAFLAWLDERCEGVEGQVRCVMETTGRYSTELAAWLREQRPSLAPAVVHAKHAADFIKSLGVRNHTDQLDARALALFGLQRQPGAFEPPSKKERELRDLSRYRDTLVRQRTALTNQMKEVTESRFVVTEQEKWLRRLERDIARVEQKLRALIAALPAVRDDVALLQSIYGVGFVTAAVVRAELGDLSRFERARQLTAHCGVNPTVCQSGTSVRGKTKMSKQGNKRVRHVLYMAAKTAIRGDNDFARDYQRLIDGGMARKAALGAIMRKILVVMRRLIIHRETYQPNRKHGAKPCGKNAVNSIIQQTARAMSV